MTQTLLFLNDIGTSELVFVMFVVLMLFGAKNIPSIAKTLGRGMREVRQASDEIKRDIAKSATDMRRDLNMTDTVDQIKKPFTDIQKSITEPALKKGKDEAPKIESTSEVKSETIKKSE
ncbi:MAG: twin-arginine translocase TatA/TatE family subunit [Crocinitomicaceae bacterium]